MFTYCEQHVIINIELNKGLKKFKGVLYHGNILF
jgi:hypothetical protein